MVFTNWKNRQHLTENGSSFFNVNAIANEANFSSIPENGLAGRNHLGIGNIRQNEYVKAEKIDESLTEIIIEKTVVKYRTPFLYNSVSDFRQPKGFQTSDLKSSFTMTQYAQFRKVAPIIKFPKL
jgi:hypothetical protein